MGIREYNLRRRSTRGTALGINSNVRGPGFYADAGFKPRIDDMLAAEISVRDFWWSGRRLRDHALTWQEALEIAVAKVGNPRYRWLCSDANILPPPNDRDAYRALMIKIASEPQDDVARMERAYTVAETEPARGGCGCCP